MSVSRIYQATPLTKDLILRLSDDAAHHVARVLRYQVGDTIHLFDGEGNEYQAQISHIDKKNVTVKLLDRIDRNVESPLELYLAQGISRGEKMDFTIQKAVELGVKKIFPILTERCNVKLDEDRRDKRLQHWRSIAIGACEQSGRNQLPEVFAPQSLQQFLAHPLADFNFVLAPKSEKKLHEISIPSPSSVVLLIGPEGGLSEAELVLAKKQHFLELNLGPRILRTETAAIAALATLQFYAGDFT